jgi:hypothetical protein
MSDRNVDPATALDRYEIGDCTSPLSGHRFLRTARCGYSAHERVTRRVEGHSTADPLPLNSEREKLSSTKIFERGNQAH